MDDDTQKEVERRLKSVEGHIGGIKRMVEAERPCMEVIQQIQAVQGSLKQTQLCLLQAHLDVCLCGLDIRGPEEVQDLRQELAAIFEQRY